MVLGRIVHYAVDAVLLSTIAAGVRRSTGFTPDSKAIPEPNIRAAVETFLGLGETVFDTVQATAVSSSYFKRDPKGSRTWSTTSN